MYLHKLWGTTNDRTEFSIITSYVVRYFSHTKLYISNLILLLLHYYHHHQNPPHHLTWMYSQGAFLDRVISPQRRMCPLCLHHLPNNFLSTCVCVLSIPYQDNITSFEFYTSLLQGAQMSLSW